jgi:multidrug efflux pump subunit AcrA (membrane-fusion protein)
MMEEDSKDHGAVDNERLREKERQANQAARQKAAQQAALDAKKTEAEKKREQRKKEREERKKQIEKLEKREAMHSGEDPEDRRLIEIAQQTFGDYKLKTSQDYQVPENQRVNFSKKRQQMVLLEGSIHKLKVDFNQKIQELKLRKKEIVEHVKKVNLRLMEINGELGVKEELFVPVIDKDAEYPENYFEITDEDIAQYKLKVEAEKAKAKKGKKGAANTQTAKKEEEEE